MALVNVKDVTFVVDQYDTALRSGLTVAQLVTTMQTLDMNNQTAVYAAIRRCNNRCNENVINVNLATVRASGTAPEDVQVINFNFKIDGVIP